MKIANITQLYAAVVCLVSICVLMFVIVGALNQIPIFISPEMRSPSHFVEFENDTNFRISLKEGETDQKTVAPSDEKELTQLRLQNKEYQLKKRSSKALEDLFDYLNILLVAGIIFAIHWRILKKSE